MFLTFFQWGGKDTTNPYLTHIMSVILMTCTHPLFFLMLPVRLTSPSCGGHERRRQHPEDKEEVHMADLARGGVGVVGCGIAGKERKKLKEGFGKGPTIKGLGWWCRNLARVREGRIRVMTRVVEDRQGWRGRSWPRVARARD
jgi:hypothetical protein